MTTQTSSSGSVGQSVPRLEGGAKVTGRAAYVHHLAMEERCEL